LWIEQIRGFALLKLPGEPTAKAPPIAHQLTNWSPIGVDSNSEKKKTKKVPLGQTKPLSFKFPIKRKKTRPNEFTCCSEVDSNLNFPIGVGNNKQTLRNAPLRHSLQFPHDVQRSGQLLPLTC
jgi:hypothetical protein